MSRVGAILDAGWPRGKATYEPRTGDSVALPVPWISAQSVIGQGDWLTFRDDASHDLCQVCGEAMNGTRVLGRYRQHGRETSGPGMHPRCAWMAISVCPHFTGADRRKHIAYAYDGDGHGCLPHNDSEPFAESMGVDPAARGLTLRALKRLARERPLGT